MLTSESSSSAGAASESDGPPGRGGRPAHSAVELETPTHRGDVIAAVLCLGFALIGYFVLVPTAVYVPATFAGTVNSPAFLPNLLFLLLAGLSLLYLLHGALAWRRSKPQGWGRISDWALASGTALICIGYIAAIYIVGMTLASAAAIAALTYYFGERRLWVVALIAVVLPALLSFFFVEIAHILFPVPLVPLPEAFAWAEPLHDAGRGLSDQSVRGVGVG